MSYDFDKFNSNTIKFNRDSLKVIRLQLDGSLLAKKTVDLLDLVESIIKIGVDTFKIWEIHRGLFDFDEFDKLITESKDSISETSSILIIDGE